MDASQLVSRWRELCQPFKVLSKQDQQDLLKLCVLGQKLIQNQGRDFVRRCENQPILLSYGSDSTPILTQGTVSQSSGGSSRPVIRRAGRATELLLERGFLTSITPLGCKSSVALLSSPKPLDQGKGAWQCFTASCAFFPMLKQLGHTGVSITAHTFDRALQSSLHRKQLQWHALFHAHHRGLEQPSNAGALTELLDWVVGCACSNHDCHNALKWSLAPVSAQGRPSTSFMWSWPHCGRDTT